MRQIIEGFTLQVYINDTTYKSKINLMQVPILQCIIIMRDLVM